MDETSKKDIHPSLQRLIIKSERAVLKLDTLIKRFDKHSFTKEEMIEIYDAWVEASLYVVIPQIWFTIPGTHSLAVFNSPQELNDFILKWDMGMSVLKMALSNYQYSLVIVTNTWEAV